MMTPPQNLRASKKPDRYEQDTAGKTWAPLTVGSHPKVLSRSGSDVGTLWHQGGPGFPGVSFEAGDGFFAVHVEGSLNFGTIQQKNGMFFFVNKWQMSMWVFP